MTHHELVRDLRRDYAAIEAVVAAYSHEDYIDMFESVIPPRLTDQELAQYLDQLTPFPF